MRRVASTSSRVWIWGMSDQDWAMFRATTPRMPRNGWRPGAICPRVVSIVAGSPVGEGESFVAESSSPGREEALTGTAAARTSSCVIRPPGPLPDTRARSTFSCRASFRVAGAALTRAVVESTTVVVSVAGLLGLVFSTEEGISVAPATVTDDWLASVEISAPSAEPSSSSMSTSPTRRRSPSTAPNRRTVPATGEGSSEVALSVSTSTRG